jgi:hypothetical protein
MAAKRATSTGKIRETPWSLMNHTKILTPAAIFAALILSAVPAHAQRRGFSGRGGFGISRGPARALGVPRGFASPAWFRGQADHGGCAVQRRAFSGPTADPSRIWPPGRLSGGSWRLPVSLSGCLCAVSCRGAISRCGGPDGVPASCHAGRRGSSSAGHRRENCPRSQQTGPASAHPVRRKQTSVVCSGVLGVRGPLVSRAVSGSAL